MPKMPKMPSLPKKSSSKYHKKDEEIVDAKTGKKKVTPFDQV